MVNYSNFQAVIWEQGRTLFRDMPWREDTRPYYILVSELMLQQTQVERVIPKFEAFITRFPDIAPLAAAPLSDVLGLWSGLGYNRRAKYLHDSAKKIMTDYQGIFPDSNDGLRALPGIGPGTAGAIAAYAFNQPRAFIETNIRTVYFHHFFSDAESVTDGELLPFLEATVDREHPREFYWALMDYGSWQKRQGAGRIMKSHHYKKQPALRGSVREVRGQIIRALISGDALEVELRVTCSDDERFAPALAALIAEGLVTTTNHRLHLTK
jgi:A/G-specific adenine glycosylase